jgi:hypothetical protein
MEHFGRPRVPHSESLSGPLHLAGQPEKLRIASEVLLLPLSFFPEKGNKFYTTEVRRAKTV